MSTFQNVLGMAGSVIEATGVAVIIIGFALAAVWFAGRLGRGNGLDAYQKLRRDLGRSLLLGLEFLVAGDIIRTVTVEQTLSSAAALAVIVLIRVVLSLTLEVEIEGRWPWQGSGT